MAAVEDDRLPRAERVPEHAGKARVPAFGEAPRVVRRRLLAGIVVDVKVIGSERPKIEVAILDFVGAEVLGSGLTRDRRREKTPRQNEAADGSRPNSHGSYTSTALCSEISPGLPELGRWQED